MWRSYPSTLRERHSAAAATLKRDGDPFGIVVAGGRDENNKHLADAEFYEIAMNQWSPLPSMHSGRLGCAAVALDDTIVVIGGQRHSAILSSAEYWTYGLPQWKRLNSMETPRAFCAAVWLAEHNMIVVMGGRDDCLSSLNSAVAYDTKRKEWRDLAPMNESRMGCSAVLLGSSEILVVGGFDGKQWLSSADVYNFHDNTWRSLSSSLPIRCGFCAAAVTSDDKFVVAIGGRNESERLDKVQCYNRETKSWVALDSKGRDGSCAATFRDTILVVGGSDGPDFSSPPSAACRGLHLNDSGRGELHSISSLGEGEDGTCKTPAVPQTLGDRSKWKSLERSVVFAIATPVDEDQDASLLTEDNESNNREQQSVASLLQHRLALDAKAKTRVVTLSLLQNGKRGLYSGEVDAKNSPHGKGSITYDADQSTYDGDWWHGFREGTGKASYANRDTYEGSFHKDEKHGEGTYRWPNGKQYIGYFSGDRKCGPGTMIWPNQIKYEGEFRDQGGPSGAGTMTFPCGTVYKGFFVKGKPEGFGTSSYSNGSEYRGEFKAGKSHGFGFFSQSGGDLVHVGRFLDDQAVLDP